MADIPYENFVFGVTKDNYIIAIRDTIARPPEAARGIVAKYSNEAQAQKAMDMLRTEWNDYGSNGCFQFPADEDMEV